MVADLLQDLQAQDLLLQQVLLVRGGGFYSPVGRCVGLSGDQDVQGYGAGLSGCRTLGAVCSFWEPGCLQLVCQERREARARAARGKIQPSGLQCRCCCLK